MNPAQHSTLPKSKVSGANNTATTIDSKGPRANGPVVATSPSSHLWPRLKHLQPSSRLVKVAFIWWLVLVVASALKLTDGFGIEGLARGASPLISLCIVLLGLLAVVCLIDVICLMASSHPASFTLYRKYPNNVPIYHEFDIVAYLSIDRQRQASIGNRLANGLRRLGVARQLVIDFYDDYPDQLTLLEPMPIRTTLPLHPFLHSSQQSSSAQKSDDIAQSHIKITYPMLPITRGTGYFGPAHIRVWSPLRWFRQSVIVTQEATTQNTAFNHDSLNSNLAGAAHKSSLRVLADFSGLMTNQLSAIFEKSVDAGVQALRQQGHGSDFLQLREYRAGDAIRQIDWKASSRLQRLMSKAYEEDNDQNVVFLLDCGEQMRHQDVFEDERDIDTGLNSQILGISESADSQTSFSRVNYFDKVLNAVLLLSYVANKQNDKVGLMTFGGMTLYLPPSKGVSLIRNMLNATADIKPTMQTSDYLMAAQALLKRLNKRSLVILITNTRAEASSELQQAMQLLSRHHQLVFANLMEQSIFDRLHGDRMPATMDDALLYHSLVNYEQDRVQLHQTLSQHTGAMCLQTTASRLPLTLTQAYLSLKRK